jgi:hypothetical protein
MTERDRRETILGSNCEKSSGLKLCIGFTTRRTSIGRHDDDNRASSAKSELRKDSIVARDWAARPIALPVAPTLFLQA